MSEWSKNLQHHNLCSGEHFGEFCVLRKTPDFPKFVPSFVPGGMSSEWNDIDTYLDKVDVKFTKPEKPLWQKWNPLI